jgi:hypothetical protein
MQKGRRNPGSPGNRAGIAVVRQFQNRWMNAGADSGEVSWRHAGSTGASIKGAWKITQHLTKRRMVAVGVQCKRSRTFGKARW